MPQFMPAAQARVALFLGYVCKRGVEPRCAAAALLVGNEGCPDDRALNGGCGGWQEDAHTDRVHNIMAVI